MVTSSEEYVQLDLLRSTPMKDERQVMWVIQDGEDVNSRQSLPQWMWPALEEKILGWAEENKKWTQRINARFAQGKVLTPSQKKLHDAFVAERSQCSLLFSMKHQCLVTRIRSNADLDRLRAECFSVVLHLSADPQNLMLQTGDGQNKRLILLQGSPTSTEELPGCFADAGVAGSLEKFLADEEDPGDSQPEDDPQVQEAMALEDGDGIEVMALSDDEQDLQEVMLGAGAVRRVKDFFNRPAYQHLESKGLAQVPPGTYIGYHKTSRSWQGFFQNGSVSLTHDGTTGRNEKEALLGVLLGLAEWYCAKHARDRLWGKHLQTLRHVSATEAIV